MTETTDLTKFTRLQELEQVIDKHLMGFLVVGRALAEVRRERLYLASHSSFEKWVRARFAFSKVRAQRLMNAVDVHENLERNGVARLPENERQSRELARFGWEQQPRVWRMALEIAGDRELSESFVRRAAREFRRQRQIGELAGRCQEPVEMGSLGLFACILADPPWRYDSGTTDPSRVIENQYPTMDLEDIKDLPVDGICTDDAVLFLWAVPPLLPEALEVMSEWGFTYKANSVWDKQRDGPGYWFRNRHEHLLLGVRGNPPKPGESDRSSSLISELRGKHSRKPDAVPELIELYYPKLPKVELFARGEARPGWSHWGAEAVGE